MNKMKIAKTLIVMTISMPIWFYLVYKILLLVDASELMWFLFWIYIPATLIGTFLGMLIEEK